MAAHPITVALVEDDPSFRSSVQSILQAAGERFRLLASFQDGETALETLPSLSPRVALVDIHLPRLSGVEVVRHLAPRLPGTEFMMLTVYTEAEHIYASIAAGATGYLLKRDSAEKLCDAIQELHEGGSPISSSIARTVLLAFRELSNSKKLTQELSSREEEILSALAQGFLYKEIADQLTISFGTVRKHIHNIYKKLHVNNRHAAADKYRQRN